ncbi:hypothetical protein, partial [Bacillus sp. S74]
MEILFLWLNKYKSINNISANFGGEYLFNFFDNSLECKKNTSHINAFFNLSNHQDRSSIQNVTGIVGENGTGKSNLLEFLMILFSNQLECLPLDTEYLLIYKEADTLYYDSKISAQHIYIQNEKTNITDSFLYKKLNFTKKSVVDIELKTIFCSNVYDARASNTNAFSLNRTFNPKILNISTNHQSTRFKSAYQRYLNEEFTRQFIFVQTFKDPLSLDEKLHIPEYVNINLENPSLLRDELEEYSHYEHTDYYVIEEALDREFYDLIGNSHNFTEKSFKFQFHRMVLLSLFNEFLNLTFNLAKNHDLKEPLSNICVDTCTDFCYSYNPKYKDYYKAIQKILHEKIDELISLEPRMNIPEYIEITNHFKNSINPLIEKRKKLLTLLEELNISNDSINKTIKLKSDLKHLDSFV